MLKSSFSTLLVVALILMSLSASAQTAIGTLPTHWDEGAQDCKAHPPPPIQVHAYNSETFILRENLCATFEAPFMYLLIGSNKALLIDTGDVSDPKQAPLAETVMQFLPGTGPSKLPLVVVHTHRHSDHCAGDGQFASLPNVQVVGFDIDSIKRFYNFTDWPNGVAQLDLGDRTIDAIPSPGHNETEVSFYDRETALFFSGDFLLPGRLMIDDTHAELASAKRVADFVRDRPVSYVLGGHIEKDDAGELFPWQSQYHPREHALQMTKEDLLELPAAVSRFNGFYTQTGNFVLMNPIRNLIVMAIAVLIVLIALVVGIVLLIRRRRRARKQANALG